MRAHRQKFKLNIAPASYGTRQYRWGYDLKDAVSVFGLSNPLWLDENIVGIDDSVHYTDSVEGCDLYPL